MYHDEIVSEHLSEEKKKVSFDFLSKIVACFMQSLFKIIDWGQSMQELCHAKTWFLGLCDQQRF